MGTALNRWLRRTRDTPPFLSTPGSVAPRVNRMRPNRDILNWSWLLRYGILNWARFPGLRNGERSSPLGEYGTGHASQHKACQDRDREGIFRYLFLSSVVRDAEDDMLDFIIDSAARLEGIGLRIRCKVV